MKLLVIDDDSVLRTGLAVLLSRLETETVVQDVESADHGLRLVKEHPDLAAIVIDPLAAGVKGATELADFVRAAAPVPVIALSHSEHPEYARHALACGARGYLPKSASPHTIQSAIRLVLGGDVYVPPLLLQDESSPVSSRSWAFDPTAHASLTHRQRAVLQLLCRGLSNKAICHRLDLSEKTVKAHVSGIFKALHVANRTQAARVALDAGLVSWGVIPHSVSS
ncbi:response regulator transcription factor [Dyella sp. M7H15-1]|uniref:LuxR C-terminal-related transcriptional regulator n=1 Tax=Dyella sp. M7H15-1 TaxID=2501295 RepID=UPI0010051CBA|nr:response regulator transcription factor [Dyella sp. M7H15-1]QAU25025.1 response regulator transcription factor [Dyella sp. M7H15-1]